MKIEKPNLKTVNIEDAIGLALGHDMTQILPGVSKKPIFKKGHIVKEEDLPIRDVLSAKAPGERAPPGDSRRK